MAEFAASELSAHVPSRSLLGVWDINDLALGHIQDGPKKSRPSMHRIIKTRLQLPDRSVYRTDSADFVAEDRGLTIMPQLTHADSLLSALNMDIPGSASLVRRPQYRIKSLRTKNLLIGLAVALVLFSLYTSINTLLTNRHATQAVNQLSKKSAVNLPDSSSNTPASNVPSTTKPAGGLAAYTVAPDLPRYISIPRLGVHARVTAVGMLSDGSLKAPGNVYDTGWYTKSAKPGKDGAMLIDGHVSSWTTKGVFYGLKNLQPGDKIEIERGDGVKFTYSVVRSQTYSQGSVDMNAAMNPVDLSKPGLNLITCTGQVIPGTSEFNKRVVVFASQV